jgi:lipoyl(octanoyl) transferase
MTAESRFRDISAPPPESRSTRAGRPDRRAPHRPASDAHPLLAAHGGVLTVDHLGTVPYVPTWELQDELADARRSRRIGDRLLLLEHFPVFTIGRGGNEANMLATPDRLRELHAELIRIDRGGDITFHGPGQIVAYPIVELADPLDLRRYVRILEDAIIATAHRFGVTGRRLDGHPGIWVDGERKVAAIGVRVKRGVTTHGLALNVDVDLGWFAEMIPCGIPDKGVTSLSRELGRPIAGDDVADVLAEELASHFGLRLRVSEAAIGTGPAGARET